MPGPQDLIQPLRNALLSANGQMQREGFVKHAFQEHLDGQQRIGADPRAGVFNAYHPPTLPPGSTRPRPNLKNKDLIRDAMIGTLQQGRGSYSPAHNAILYQAHSYYPDNTTTFGRAIDRDVYGPHSSVSNPTPFIELRVGPTEGQTWDTVSEQVRLGNPLRDLWGTVYPVAPQNVRDFDGLRTGHNFTADYNGVGPFVDPTMIRKATVASFPIAPPSSAPDLSSFPTLKQGGAVRKTARDYQRGSLRSKSEAHAALKKMIRDLFLSRQKSILLKACEAWLAERG